MYFLPLKRLRFSLWSLTTGTSIKNDSRLLLAQSSLLHHRSFVQPTLCLAVEFFNLCFACL